MCDFNGEYGSFYRETVRRARKEHRCCACREVIRPGDSYVAAAGKWEGGVESFKHCMRCNRVMRGLGPIADGPVDIMLDCGADPLEPGDHPELDELAFATREEMQERAR